MIEAEFFFRRHFWTSKNTVYSPLVEATSLLSMDFCWEEDFLLFLFREKRAEPFVLQWPEYKSKDALVLFLHTRPSASSRTLTRPCHQFLLLPEAVEGVQSKEITKFHGYETRSLVQENKVLVTTAYHKKERTFEVRVPVDVLFGWEASTREVSFAFSYFSSGNAPVHFPIPQTPPERVPSLWAHIHRE